MSGYCTTSDVQMLLPQARFASDTHPTTLQIGVLISSIAAEMKGVLSGAGYAVEQTDSDALDALKLINSYGTAALVERGAFPSPKGGGGWKELWGLYQRGLERIKKGEIPGLTTSSGASVLLPRSRYTYDSSTYSDSAFSYGEDQW